MLHHRIGLILSLIAVSTFLAGCGSGIVINLPNPDDAQYTIRNVQVTGPAQAPGSYNISYEVVITTDGGGASPVVSLVDEDDTLRFGDDLLSQAQVVAVAPPAPRGVYPQTAVLSLDCSQVFTVVGSPVTRDSGEGRPSCFFCPTDDADIYAQVSRADGSGSVRSAGTIDVRCQ